MGIYNKIEYDDAYLQELLNKGVLRKDIASKMNMTERLLNDYIRKYRDKFEYKRGTRYVVKVGDTVANYTVIKVYPDVSSHRQCLVRCSHGVEREVSTRMFFKARPKSCNCFLQGRKEDLLGRTINNIFVCSVSNRTDKNGHVFYDCRCSCGKELEVARETLKSNAIISCGCHKEKYRNDFINKRFGKLLVIEYLHSENGKHGYRCQCDCGVSYIAARDALEKGKVVSCGCYRSNRFIENNKDILNKKFGCLTALELIDSTEQSKVLCQCDCGKFIKVGLWSLLNERKDCGCYIYRRKHNAEICTKELKGKKYGRLTIIEAIVPPPKSKRGTRVKAQCDCGTIKVYSFNTILSGRTTSCGCYFRERSSERFSAHQVEFSQTGWSKYKWYIIRNEEPIKMRSSYEVLLANYYMYSGINFIYEGETFKLREAARYTPDFYLPESNIYVEVKGYDPPGKQEVRRALFIEAGYTLHLYGELELRKICSLNRTPRTYMSHAEKQGIKTEDYFAKGLYLSPENQTLLHERQKGV